MSNGKVCPQCGTKYDAEHRFCARDGATLVAESPNDSLIGAVIADRYHVLQKLGEGGMGEVYLAEHVRIKRKVAVKVMRRWMTADAVALGRFHREAENASQISHSNVATIYDFGETGDGMVYFAMEYVDGEPLAEVLKREPRVGVARSCDIVRQVADALAAAHALGILHRDLKPDNVMLGKTRVGTEQVKIVDFGISRVMDRGTQQFTSTGMVIGTPDYMSPEQLSGDALDARTDIYALALIAFRMLTGTPAFLGNNAQESLLARLTKPATRLVDAAPDVAWPDAMQEVFDRALHADPEQRFGDAKFAAALDASTAGMSLTPGDQRYLHLLTQRTARRAVMAPSRR
ncbi:MAG: serine/threonine-protein kinase [Gemmatimonadaceae bacterium]